mmetsp:Transcript_36366/g.88083  ORF Transcript_36366/g.88083 Transcript_36366/m.88083 type:complete len:96 (+) Transcript_36366:684-971(+)
MGKSLRSFCEGRSRLCILMLVTSNDFKPLLHWHGIAVKDQPSKIKEKKKEWLDRVSANEGPVGFAQWTDTDEAQLTELRRYHRYRYWACHEGNGK